MLKMVTRTDFVEELVKRGYDAKTWEKVKNGVPVSGIMVAGDNGISSFIRVDRCLDDINKNGKSFESAVEEFIDYFKRNKLEKEFDVTLLSNKEFVLSHLSIALQKAGNQNLVKKPCAYFGGVEQFLYLSTYNNKEIQLYAEINPDNLVHVGVSEEEAWERAKQNLHDSIEIWNMLDILREKKNMDVSQFDEEDIPMYILSNKGNSHGASGVLDEEILREFAKKHHTDKLVLLPSSVHEVIILTDADEDELESMKHLVASVNEQEVAPEDQLSDTPTIWKL